MIEFRGTAKRLDDIDLPRIGKMIGVGEDEIHAVLEVESSGSGFDSKGRPKMLFEPHAFYRCLPIDKRSRAISEGLAYPAWKPGAYPSDSYPRLAAAIKIDETAALKAASWGLGQILGENHAAAGYATVQAMVRDCVADEEKHLEMMVRFIKSKGLDAALRMHDWVRFARGYNGAQYAKHNYHGRLAAAFARWQKIKDTPFTLDDLRERAAKETRDAATPATTGPKKNNTAGGAAGTVVVGGGAVIANETKKKGASTGEIVTVLVCTALIAAAVFLLIRNWRRS